MAREPRGVAASGLGSSAHPAAPGGWASVHGPSCGAEPSGSACDAVESAISNAAGPDTGIVARIFILTQPQLMRIHWFAALYARFMPWKEALFERVPELKTLIVEAKLRPEDINYVRTGTLADVRLTAYKQRNTQLVEGKVSYVSGDRLVETGTGTAYYLVQVEVPPQALVEAGNLKLQAGMPAEVFMRTDRRTALDYLLAPVTAYFRRGMREPL